MRRLVAITYIIMLSTALLLGMGTILPAAASSPTQKIDSFVPKPTSLTYLTSVTRPMMCTNDDLGYSPKALTIAATRQKGLITPEIIEEKVGEQTSEETVLVQQPLTPVAEVVVVPASPSAIPAPSITQVPEAGSSGALNAEVLFSLVNQTRVQAGLPPFEKHPDVCAVVASRAPELDNEIYGNSYMHAGFKARNLPFHATENMISQQSEQAALNWWLNSPVHRSAILGAHRYACVACAGKSCAMIFSNVDNQ